MSVVTQAIQPQAIRLHTQQQPEALLRVNDIEVIYDGAILAVSGVSLAVPQGSIVALLGANGAGKSTTLKAISGLVRAGRAALSRGSIHFKGQPSTDTSANLLVQQGIVHVLEGRHVFPHLTVEENLISGGFVRRPGRQALQTGLERIYAWFPRLKEKRKVQAGYTSGGEQQMVAIGRALMTNPSLVLLDEPSMGLAPLIVQEIFDIVSQLNASENVSFLIAEQNIPVALKHAHYGYVLETGKVVLSGSAEQLLQDSALQDAYLGKRQ
ncbi:ABC transporter ATP-binding protein [Methylobacillus methanolivorans]